MMPQSISHMCSCIPVYDVWNMNWQEKNLGQRMDLKSKAIGIRILVLSVIIRFVKKKKMYIHFFILKQRDNKHLIDSFWSLNKIAFETYVAQCLVILQSFLKLPFGRLHEYHLLTSISVWYRSLFSFLMGVTVIIQQRIMLLTTVIHALFSYYTLYINI